VKAVPTKAVLNKYSFYRNNKKARSDAGFFVGGCFVSDLRLQSSRDPCITSQTAIL